VAAHPSVTFGSYPSWGGQHFRTKLTLEAATQVEVEAARADMEELGPVRFDPKPTEDAWDKLQRFVEEETTEPHMAELVRDSLRVVEECFAKYTPERVSVCFNGGKDCIAMLHIVHAFHQKHFPDLALKSFYIREEQTFPEVERFMETSIASYGLQNSIYPGPMKPALARVIEEDPEIQATILGVRDGDPGSQYMAAFSPTDGDWPR
jgi:FAD synthetase